MPRWGCALQQGSAAAKASEEQRVPGHSAAQQRRGNERSEQEAAILPLCFLPSPLSALLRPAPFAGRSELPASGTHGGTHSHDTCVWLFPVKIISYSIMEKNRGAQPDSQSHGGKMRGVAGVQNVPLLWRRISAAGRSAALQQRISEGWRSPESAPRCAKCTPPLFSPPSPGEHMEYCTAGEKPSEDARAVRCRSSNARRATLGSAVTLVLHLLRCRLFIWCACANTSANKATSKPFVTALLTEESHSARWQCPVRALPQPPAPTSVQCFPKAASKLPSLILLPCSTAVPCLEGRHDSCTKHLR